MAIEIACTSFTMKNTIILLCIAASILLSSCNDASQNNQFADLILTNGNIITLDNDLPKAEAIAIGNGRIQYIGTTAQAEKFAGEDTEKIDLKGSTAVPGLIEGHGHFSGLGYSLIKLNLMKTKNWDEIVAMVPANGLTDADGIRKSGTSPSNTRWKAIHTTMI